MMTTDLESRNTFKPVNPESLRVCTVWLYAPAFGNANLDSGLENLRVSFEVGDIGVRIEGLSSLYVGFGPHYDV